MSAQLNLLTGSQRRWAATALMLATAMQAADATIVNVALPQMERTLGGGIELGAWVMTSYLIAAAIVVPLTGWLRRRFGTWRLYSTALCLFVLASLLCSFAQSAAAIILFRLLQGAGGGVIPALTQAVLHDLYPRERHGRMLAIWGAVAMLGPILGPALGGIITDLSSWRWVFAVNLPLGIVAMWRMHRLLPKEGAAVGAAFDVIGLLLLIAGIGALQLGLQRGIGHVWLRTPELLGEVSIATIAFAITAARVKKSGLTMLRLDVFKDVNFAAAAFFNFVTSALLFTTIVFLPTLAQGPLGYPATVAGLTIVPRGVLMMLVVLAVGQVLGKIDFRIVLAVGSGLTGAGLALLTAVQSRDDLLWLVVGSSAQAMGAGMILMPLSTYAFITLPVEMRTDAAGLYSLLRQLGCACGVAVMSAVLQAKISVHLADLSAAGAAPAALQPNGLAIGATLQAYADSFRIMSIAALVVMPGILLFRAGRAVDADDAAKEIVPRGIE
jgi:MFS transporter, DHA2 family, multidrug resistance protein